MADCALAATPCVAVPERECANFGSVAAAAKADAISSFRHKRKNQVRSRTGVRIRKRKEIGEPMLSFSGRIDKMDGFVQRRQKDVDDDDGNCSQYRLLLVIVVRMPAGQRACYYVTATTRRRSSCLCALYCTWYLDDVFLVDSIWDLGFGIVSVIWFIIKASLGYEMHVTGTDTMIYKCCILSSFVSCLLFLFYFVLFLYLSCLSLLCSLL